MKKFLVSMLVLSISLVSSVVAPISDNTANALPAPTNFEYTSLLDNLGAYWPFDDNMWDYSSNVNYANTTTAYYSNEGRLSRSLFFDRSLLSTVSIPDDPTLNNFDTEMAFSSWFRLPSGEAADYALVSQRDGFGDNFELFVNFGGVLRLSLWDRLDAQTVYEVDVPIVADAWHQVILNVKASEYVRIYFDGVMVLEDTVNVPTQLSNDGVFTTLGDNGYGLGYFDGYIDDVAIWKRTLTDDEISHLYNGALGRPIPVVRNYLNWDFEDSFKKSKVIPLTNPLHDYYPDKGHATGVSLYGGQEFYLWGVGSGGSGTNAPINRNWVDGADVNYYRVSLNSEGMQDLKVSSKQRSSNTGPRDFKLQYSVSGRLPLVWNDVSGGTITVGDNFTSGVLTDVALPAECNDSSVLYLRWLQTSNTSVGGGVVASAGTNRIDDIIVTGTKLNFEPVLTSINPSSVVEGSPDTTIEVFGKQFTTSSVVSFDMSTDLVTTYVSSTKLTAVIPAALLASAEPAYQIYVRNPAPGGGNSNGLNFSVDFPLPILTTINPNNAVLGSLGFTMTLTGSDFRNSWSVVRFNGSDKVTRFIDSNTLEADIPASDLLSVGSYNVTVFTGLPGGGESLPQVFDVVNPVPAVTSITPATATQNGANLNLTVYGSGFMNTSVVRFNGIDKATTYVDSTTLTALIPSADLAVVGNYPIEVFTGLPGGGLSNAETISVIAPAPVVPSSSGGGGGAILPSALVFNITGGSVVIDDPMNLQSENIDIIFDGFKDVKSYLISEDPNFKGSVWTAFSNSIVYRVGSELGDKTLYFRFKSNSGLNSDVIRKDVSLQKNGSPVLHNSADEKDKVDFSKLSMNERVKYNLEKLREKKKLWETERNKKFKKIVIPYEVDFSKIPSEDAIVSFNPYSYENSLFSFQRDLSLGMRGDDVKNLQIILEKLGYYYFEDGATGYFGEVTRRALLDFQRDNGQDSSGVLGLQTGSLMNNEYLYLLDLV
ncbi:MAG: LamG-like jellyroll fold domain-containing protein [Candidatus Gracilibacteria bacterium]|jgi:hypothetical protein|nr:LamG-like jellyroll fold domain-containing protein [Candidatus Gracilibacteria bacterium]